MVNELKRHFQHTYLAWAIFLAWVEQIYSMFRNPEKYEKKTGLSYECLRYLIWYEWKGVEYQEKKKSSMDVNQIAHQSNREKNTKMCLQWHIVDVQCSSVHLHLCLLLNYFDETHRHTKHKIWQCSRCILILTILFIIQCRLH